MSSKRGLKKGSLASPISRMKLLNMIPNNQVEMKEKNTIESNGTDDPEKEPPMVITQIKSGMFSLINFIISARKSHRYAPLGNIKLRNIHKHKRSSLIDQEDSSKKTKTVSLDSFSVSIAMKISLFDSLITILLDYIP